MDDDRMQTVPRGDDDVTMMRQDEQEAAAALMTLCKGTTRSWDDNDDVSTREPCLVDEVVSWSKRRVERRRPREDKHQPPRDHYTLHIHGALQGDLVLNAPGMNVTISHGVGGDIHCHAPATHSTLHVYGPVGGRIDQGATMPKIKHHPKKRVLSEEMVFL